MVAQLWCRIIACVSAAVVSAVYPISSLGTQVLGSAGLAECAIVHSLTYVAGLGLGLCLTQCQGRWPTRTPTGGDPIP